MYYLYKTIIDGAPYLHKTKSKDKAESYGMIAAADSLEEIQDITYSILHSDEGQVYVNKGRGEATRKKKEHHPRPDRPIQCIETGEVFRTLQELADTIGCTKQNISYQLLNGNKIMGKHYKRIETDEPIS